MTLEYYINPYEFKTFEEALSFLKKEKDLHEIFEHVKVNMSACGHLFPYERTNTVIWDSNKYANRGTFICSFVQEGIEFYARTHSLETFYCKRDEIIRILKRIPKKFYKEIIECAQQHLNSLIVKSKRQLKEQRINFRKAEKEYLIEVTSFDRLNSELSTLLSTSSDS